MRTIDTYGKFEDILVGSEPQAANLADRLGHRLLQPTTAVELPMSPSRAEQTRPEDASMRSSDSPRFQVG